MTVLQKIIDKLDEGNHHVAVVNYLKSQLPAEEQQIRDAWKAGDKYGRAEVGEYYGGSLNENPDSTTYITNLKNS